MLEILRETILVKLEKARDACLSFCFFLWFQLFLLDFSGGMRNSRAGFCCVFNKKTQDTN